MVDLINARITNSSPPLPLALITQIFYQTCRSLQYLHSLQPKPLVHRDMKAENLLINADAVLKLCDFGSATTETYHPDASWTAAQRDNLSEELQKFTTPMYRAPEMLNLYNHQPIGVAMDVWVSNCIIFFT